jgi:hypothetical protein
MDDDVLRKLIMEVVAGETVASTWQGREGEGEVKVKRE